MYLSSIYTLKGIVVQPDDSVILLNIACLSAWSSLTYACIKSILMADIFISYAREDQEWVKALAESLEAQGWSTWWDRSLVAGESFDRVIERELNAAKCVVVLWSKHSVESRWVRSEATVGLRRKILAPVFIDEVDQPLAFTLIHAVDLTGWNRKETDERFEELVHDIRQIVGETFGDAAGVQKGDQQPLVFPVEDERPNSTLLVIGAVLFVVVIAIGVFTMMRGGKSTEGVVGADSLSVPLKEEITTPLETVTNSIGVELVELRAGRFLMGSEHGKLDETPIHPVQITGSFYMGKTEVTQGQWEQVMGSNPSFFDAEKEHPVEKVSMDAVEDFLQKLNSIDSLYTYRLPTEAEWEYACRAGTSTAYHFGDDVSLLGNYAVYGREVNEGHAPVKSKQPNAWGLYDMMGNVSEWTADYYKSDYYESSPADNPQGPERGNHRVLRGGGYIHKDTVVRCALRGSSGPAFELPFVGFRVVATPRLTDLP